MQLCKFLTGDGRVTVGSSGGSDLGEEDSVVGLVALDGGDEPGVLALGGGLGRPPATSD